MALTLLNQIFYNTNKFDADPTLYENFMYLDSYAKNIKPIVIMNSVEPIVQIEKPKQEPQLFSPKKHDQLFWSIYVLDIGEEEYHMIGSKHRNVEMNEKQKIMNYLRENRNHVKTTAQANGLKISNVKMQFIESEFMIDRKTSYYMFWVMCMFYRINAILVQESVYMEFQVDSVYPTYLFEKNSEFHIQVDCVKLTKEKIHNLKQNKLQIDPFVEKILKGVSTYKIPELQYMMDVLNLYIEKEKPKKQDYYQTIIEKLVSMKIQN
jgi:hypothetical protein